ncbi:MAG: phosphoglucosamine mutase [Phycisphaerales bacterium]|nr:MAG: phosphoglucosamine mutase [Phycisphaerales bacterium]
MSDHNDTKNAPLMLSVSGCRGVIGRSITPEVASRFASAFVGALREDEGLGGGRLRIVFGRDGRAHSEALRMGAIAGLLASGCDVIDLDVAPTPTVGVMTEHHDAHAGVVLTASHNPAEWNGLKCLMRAPDGGRCAAPDAQRAGRIVRRFKDGRTAYAGHEGQGERSADDTGAHVHVARALKAVERIAPVESIRAAKLRVVVDCVNASGARGARLLLDALGCVADMLHADDTGLFPHPPEPLRENLGDLCDRVRATNAHAGFAQDTDADRLALVDEHGAYIGEEYTLALCAASVLGASADAGGATLCTNLSTSRMVEDVAALHGARVVRTPVGEANVVEAMLREGSPLGGEGNGGVIWPDVAMIRDSLGSMALTLALMARTGKPLSQLAAGVPAYVIEKRKVSIEGLDAAKACAAVAGAFPDARVDTQDGVRIDTGEGDTAAWLHVRASNTEPILRLIGEARTSERARALLDQAAVVIR